MILVAPTIPLRSIPSPLQSSSQAILRTSVLVSWCTFLAAPCAWRLSWVCFVWGALVYVVMTILGIRVEPNMLSARLFAFLELSCCNSTIPATPSPKIGCKCTGHVGQPLLPFSRHSSHSWASLTTSPLFLVGVLLRSKGPVGGCTC